MANNQTSDFFEPLMQLKGSKIFFITLSTVCSTFAAILGYGIWWFVKNSSEAKQTLVNTFILQVCFSAFQYTLLVQVKKIFIAFAADRNPRISSLCNIRYTIVLHYFIPWHWDV